MNHRRNLIIAFTALICVFLTGVVGYSITERNSVRNDDHDNWSVFDAIFMTVITLTTVGYDDGEMSPAGKVFYGLFAHWRVRCLRIQHKLCNRLYHRRATTRNFSEKKDEKLN